MGRMKDKFIEEQERQLSENTFEWDFTPNDDCCGQQCGCHEENEANAEFVWTIQNSKSQVDEKLDGYGHRAHLYFLMEYFG